MVVIGNVPTESEKLLVAAALAAVEDLGLREAADALGISHETVRRWREGLWKRVDPPLRRHLRARLREMGVEVPQPARPNSQSRDSRDRLSVREKALRYDLIAGIVGLAPGSIGGEAGTGTGAPVVPVTPPETTGAAKSAVVAHDPSLARAAESNAAQPSGPGGTKKGQRGKRRRRQGGDSA